MSPKEIQSNLPNGFHGAIIERVTIDYFSRTAEFAMNLLVKNDATHSVSRKGRFQVSGLAFCTLGVPSPHYDYMSPSGIEIGSLLDTTPKILPSLQAFRNELGSAVFFHSFFVEEWNEFIHFAGTDATFEWLEP